MRSRVKRHLFSFILIINLSIVSISCIETPLEPILPTTDVQLSIPLVNRLKYFEEFVKDTLIKRDSKSDTSGFYYSAAQTLSPITIDTIKAYPGYSSQQLQLGLFQVDFPSSLNVFFSYKTITGSDPPPVPIVVPPATYSLPRYDHPPIQSFEYAEFAIGTLTLVVRNLLPIPVNIIDPIILKNNRSISPIDTSEIARFSFVGEQFQSGQTKQQSVSMTNIRMQNLLRFLSMRIQTPGSTTPVSVESSSGLEFSISLSDASVKAAKGLIPKQSILDVVDSVVVLDDSLSVQNATFRSGQLNVVIENGVDVKVSAFVRFNEIRHRQTGQSLTIRHQFNGRDRVTIAINARDYRIVSLRDTIGSYLTFSVGIETIESEVFSEVRSTDIVKAEVIPVAPFVLESLTGRIKPTLLKIHSGASGVNMGEATAKFKGSFTFDSVKISLNIQMTGGFPVDYDLRLIAMNRKSKPAKIDSLRIPAPFGSITKRFYPANNKTTEIILDNSIGLNTFLSKFALDLPDTFIVRGSVLVNPPDIYQTLQGRQTIWDTTKIYAAVDLTFPLKLGIEGGELTDTVDIGSENVFPKDFSKSIKKGTIYFEITNALPIQLRFRTAFLGTVIGNKRDTLVRVPSDGPRVVLPAIVDQKGNVKNPQVSSFNISLTGTEMDKINSSDVMWYKFEIETSGGGKVPVRIRSNDFIRIRASANTVYTINKK